MIRLSLIDAGKLQCRMVHSILPAAANKYICLPLHSRQEFISQCASRQDIFPVSKLLVWVIGGRVEAQAPPSIPKSTRSGSNHMASSPTSSQRSMYPAPILSRSYEHMTWRPSVFLSALRLKRLFGSPCTIVVTSHLCHTQSDCVLGTTDEMPRVHVRINPARMTSMPWRMVS
jgi:hypothetical protein